MTSPPRPLTIDFIAYHHLQAQAAESVFAELSKRHTCRWLIGPGQSPTGAEVAVLLDHRPFQPLIRKGEGGYRYLFHLTHDLGDLELYSEEYLGDMDTVFVPTKTHLQAARRALGEGARIVVGGWPKYDRLRSTPVEEPLRGELEKLPHPFTVLYASSYANTWEWRSILPLLFALPVNVIIKNHIYVNPGQPLPEGQEPLYRECLNSAEQMETFARQAARKGVVIAPRALNICTLFPYAQLLISDASSCNLEFLPFGISIETGAGPKESAQPEAGLVTREVHFLPLPQLEEVLSSSRALEDFVRRHGESKPSVPFIAYDPQNPAGEIVSMSIDALLKVSGEDGRQDAPSAGGMEPLLGFDTAGEVFTCRGRVLRGVFPGHGCRVQELYRRLTEAGLFESGLVRTSICHEEAFNRMGYDLVLEHEPVPFITYAHEWPGDMFRDAALFQIDLSLELARSGFWLKDCGVQSNVLFDSTRPVFVDFLSICSGEELEEQEFLAPQGERSPFAPLWSRRSAFFNEIYQRMFYPYFLYPMHLLHQGKRAETRNRVLATALNSCFESISYQEAFCQADPAELLMHRQAQAAREHALACDDWERFLRILRDEIAQLTPGTMQSNYTSYYDLKNENFDAEPSPSWGEKQRAVFDALQRHKPATVLDVGANTGWFSKLAAKMGSRVVSLDIDEASVNVLYHCAKSQGLDILPLVMDITNLPGDVPPFPGYEKDPHMLQSRLNTKAPLLLSADKRLKCDMVLALALVHHLCLGLGFDLGGVVDRLASFALKQLVLEFVAKEDKLIVAEPEFFPAFCKNPDAFGWYSQENLTRELGKHFSRIETSESSAGRMMLICSR